MIKEYDKIRLHSGERATILEVFTESDFLAEIISNTAEIRIEEIQIKDIKSVIKEVEEPVVFIKGA
jgi:hypothetical protein